MLQHRRDYQDNYEVEDLAENEIETRYIYIYEEDPEKRPWSNWQWPDWKQWDTSRFVRILVQVLALGLLSAFTLIPDMPAYRIKTITVPVLLLPQQQFQVATALFSTGHTTLPATKAKGVLTLYNGSFFVQSLPAGFIVSTPDRTEVITDEAVMIPANNPPSDGIATVQAHAVFPGHEGNIPPYTIHQHYGEDISIKNLTAFSGGRDASTATYTTNEDRAKALNTARQQLQQRQAQEKPAGLLQRPCSEIVKQQNASLLVSWSCQYITYKMPANVQVLYARIQGGLVILTVETVMLPS